MARRDPMTGRFVREPAVAAEELSDGGRRFAAVVVPSSQSGRAANFLDNPEEQVQYNKHWVYTAIRVISQAVAGTVLKFYVRRKKDGTDGWPLLEEYDPNHPLLRLFSDINPFRTEREHWMLSIAFLELTGDLYWYLPTNALRVPSELWIVHSQHMKVIPSTGSYISGYAYGKQGKELIFDPSEIIHIRYPNAEDEWYGKSPLQAAAEQVDSYVAMKTSQYQAFKNGIMPGMVIKYSGENLDQKQKDIVRADIERLYRGTARSGRTMILEGDVEVKPVTLKPQEMGYLASSRVGQDEILATFGVPAAMAGISKDVNRSSTDGMIYAFTKFTLKPKLDLIAGALNKYVCPRFDRDIFCEFDVDIPKDRDADRADEEMALTQGALTINEWRAEHGYKPVPWGDKPFAKGTPPEINSDDGKDKDEGKAVGFTPPTRAQRAPPDADTLVRLIFDEEKDSIAFADVAERHVGKALKMGARKELANLGSVADFSMKSPEAVAYMRSKNTDYWRGTVAKTTQTRLRRTLASGIDAGEGAQQLARRVRKEMTNVGRVRALRIARTETTDALNAGSEQIMVREGVEKKEWVTTFDGRTRDTHMSADGQIVPVGKSFTVGGASLRRPGDTSAPSREVVNCRCTITSVVGAPGESPRPDALRVPEGVPTPEPRPSLLESLKDVSDYAAEHGVHASLRGMNVDNAWEAVDAVIRENKLYSNVRCKAIVTSQSAATAAKKKLFNNAEKTLFGGTFGNVAEQVIGQAWEIQVGSKVEGMIYLRPGAMQRDFLKSLQSRKWIVDGTPGGVVRHEFGHLVGVMQNKTQISSWTLLPSRKRELAKNLSKYATASMNESFAEMYSAHRRGTLPARMKRDFKRVLGKRLTPKELKANQAFGWGDEDELLRTAERAGHRSPFARPLEEAPKWIQEQAGVAPDEAKELYASGRRWTGDSRITKKIRLAQQSIGGNASRLTELEGDPRRIEELIAKMPKFEKKTLFRGMHMSKGAAKTFLQTFEQGNVVQLDATTSFTSAPEQAARFMLGSKTDTQVLMTVRGGVDRSTSLSFLTAHGREKEVVVGLGTKLKITEVRKVGKRTVKIWAEEVLP